MDICIHVCKCYKAKSFAALAQNAQHVAFSSFIYICRFYSHTYLAVSAVCLYVCVLGCVCVRGRVAFKPQMRLRVTILWAKPRTWLALMKTRAENRL